MKYRATFFTSLDVSDSFNFYRYYDPTPLFYNQDELEEFIFSIIREFDKIEHMNLIKTTTGGYCWLVSLFANTIEEQIITETEFGYCCWAVATACGVQNTGAKCNMWWLKLNK